MTTLRAATIQCVADEHGAQTYTITRGQTTYTVLAHDRRGAEDAVFEHLRRGAQHEEHEDLFGDE